MIVVVAAVIESDGRFLVTRRPTGTHMAGLWEFPGGKVDGGETHVQALRRELVEELDTDVDVAEQLHEVVFDYSDKTVALHFYRCRLLGTPRAMLGQEMAWVERDSLSALPFPEADRDLIDMLRRSPAGP